MIGDHVDPGKKLIQIVISAVVLFPRHHKVNAIALVLQHRGQDVIDSKGGVSINCDGARGEERKPRPSRQRAHPGRNLHRALDPKAARNQHQILYLTASLPV